MKKQDTDLFNELSYYTLEHPDKGYFIHQHIVDAFRAQKADKNIKPISIVFSLTGLYLYLVKNYSGRQVQLAHMKLVKSKRTLPLINLPESRGELSLPEVLAAQPGNERDKMIKEWCCSVWIAYRDGHELIATFARKELEI
jgi:hypothetical protein